MNGNQESQMCEDARIVSLITGIEKKHIKREYQRQYRENHKEERRIHAKSYRENHKERIKECKKAWSKSHPEKIKEYSIAWRLSNLDRSNEIKREWANKNPDKVRNTNRIWRDEHTEAVAAMGRRAAVKKRSTPKGKLSSNISRMIRRSLHGSKGRSKWETLAGYNTEALKSHIEKQFKHGMSWSNYGEWHIDHIIPVSVFNFKTPEDHDFKRCWALKNLQPMWAKENHQKKDKIYKHFQPSLTI